MTYSRTPRFVVLLALMLSGCGPEAVRSTLFPVRYAVRSDVEVRIDGRERRGSFVQRCSVSDQTDSIVGLVQTTTDGDSPWFETEDGGILVVGGLVPCRWWEAKPALDMQVDGLRPELPAVQDNVTWRFDSAQRPTRVDVYRAPALMGSEGPLAVNSVRMTVVSDQAGSGLRDAFPGAARFGGWDASLDHAVTTPFVGVEGRVRPVEASDPCLEQFAGGVAQAPACPFYPGRHVDAAEIRDVAFTADGLRFTAEAGTPAGLKTRLYRQDLLPGGGEAGRWEAARVEVCIPDRCEAMGGPMTPILQIHDRERGLVYEVRRTSHGFSPEDFGHPRTRPAR